MNADCEAAGTPLTGDGEMTHPDFQTPLQNHSQPTERHRLQLTLL